MVGYATDMWPSEPLTRDMIFEALNLAQDQEADTIFNKIQQAEAADAHTAVAASA